MSGNQAKNLSGFARLEQRVIELQQQCGGLQPRSMLELLARADANPALDIQRELDARMIQINPDTTPEQTDCG